MFPNLGMGELIVILCIVLLLFGAKRLPEVSKSLGKSIRSFKEGMSDTGNDEKTGSDSK